MKTIYYSELLNRQFNSEQECLAAEKQYQEQVLAKQEAENKLKEQKATRAKEVESAYKELKDAERRYLDLRNKFVEDYGQFHMTYRDKAPVITIEDLFKALF